MNTFALVAFALWALFLRYLPKILQFIKLYKFSQTLPGPSISEFIENAKKGQILEWMKELRQKYGPVFRIWLGKDLMVFFCDPEDVKCILGSNTLLHKSPNYRMAEIWLGKGLLTSGGKTWHRRRKLLTPAFHFKILSEFKQPMEENCKILMSKLREKANGETFDIYPYITLFALDAICETAMGIKKHAQMQSSSEYVTAVKYTCRIVLKKSFSFWQRLNIFYNYTAAGKARNAAVKVLHDETKRVISLRREILANSSIHKMSDAEKSDEFGRKRRLAFLDMLLISQMEGNGLTDEEIREEVDTFMFEGHDTTSSALGFAVYLLSQHAEVQQRAYEEALACEGREKDTMPYMEAIIKETLRLYPSVPMYSRAVESELQVGNITLPSGINVTTLAYLVHRNAKHFPDPEKFNPERFMAANNDLHPFSFVAFSAGPRNCIGQKFAMLELKCTLSNLLRNFELLPVENFKPQAVSELVLKSFNGIQIRIKAR